MPRELVWANSEINDRDGLDDYQCQRVRFRKPMLIDPNDIVAVMNTLFARHNQPSDLYQLWPLSVVVKTDSMTEYSKEMPDYDNEKYSTQKIFSFTLRMEGVAAASILRIIHNIPHQQYPKMGSMTWLNYGQQATSIDLILDDNWFERPRKQSKKNRQVYKVGWLLYWWFGDWVNYGEIVNLLSQKGYDLNPQFDPSWINCVVEDQCQSCDRVYATMPHRLGKYKLWHRSRNWCRCRRKLGSPEAAILRTFKIMGIYPISPEEAELASNENVVRGDAD